MFFILKVQYTSDLWDNITMDEWNILFAIAQYDICIGPHRCDADLISFSFFSSYIRVFVHKQPHQKKTLHVKSNDELYLTNTGSDCILHVVNKTVITVITTHQRILFPLFTSQEQIIIIWVSSWQLSSWHSRSAPSRAENILPKHNPFSPALMLMCDMSRSQTVLIAFMWQSNNQ